MGFHDYHQLQLVILSLRHFVAFHHHEISGAVLAALGSIAPRQPKDFAAVAERLSRLGAEEFDSLVQKLEEAPPDHYGSLTAKELGSELTRLKRPVE